MNLERRDAGEMVTRGEGVLASWVEHCELILENSGGLLENFNSPTEGTRKGGRYGIDRCYRWTSILSSADVRG